VGGFCYIGISTKKSSNLQKPPAPIMRQKFVSPMLSGFITPIDEIEIPTNSRARIYPTLIALQEIYKRKQDVVELVYQDLLRDCAQTTNDLVDPIIEDLLVSESSTKPSFDEVCAEFGAPGMTAWQSLVAVALRRAMNLTYDDLEVLFNHNQLLREFLQIPRIDKTLFSESRLGKNCRKISVETIKAIDDAVIEIALEVGIEDGSEIRGDSYACKTNIHHPSDTKAIEEACRKVIKVCLRDEENFGGWRQYEYWIKKTKKMAMKLIQAKRSKIRNKQIKSDSIKLAYRNLIEATRKIQEKAFLTWETMTIKDGFEELGYYMCCLELMVDLAERRTQHGEEIDSSEKVFSIFEPHTELIHRGKFPTPIEYGHRVFVAEGKSGIILDHRVMENGVLDQHETLPLLKRLCDRYGKLKVLSLDKGYNIKDFNPSDESDSVSLFALPSKGYKNKEKKEFERSKSFVDARKWRAGVESCIGALMRGNGGDLCLDKNIRGYRRWVSACVLSRNLITLGRHLLNNILEKSA
jgi:transposase, IS5 family